MRALKCGPSWSNYLEAKPSTRRISVLWSYVPPLFAAKEEIEPRYAELRNAERVLGVKVHIIETAKSDQVPAALAQIETAQVDALLLTTGIPYNVRSAITQFAVDKRLPAITDYDGRLPSGLIHLFYR